MSLYIFFKKSKLDLICCFKTNNMRVTFVAVLFFLFSFSACNVSHQPVEDNIPIYDSLSISSVLLGETRKINIYTPSSYKNDNDSLSVLYMLDGGIKEDFPHIANTIDKLINSNTIPPMILVGIENTQRRRDLTGPTEVEEDKKVAPVVGQSQNFRNFITSELFSEINKRYRTTAGKTIIGESLAGLFVVETFIKEPAMFDNYIAMDPSLWWNNAGLVKTADSVLHNFSAANKKLWFAGSGAKDIYVHTETLAEILKSKQVPGLRYFYSAQPNEEHGTIFRATKESALTWVFSNN